MEGKLKYGWIPGWLCPSYLRTSSVNLSLVCLLPQDDVYLSVYPVFGGSGFAYVLLSRGVLPHSTNTYLFSTALCSGTAACDNIH